MNYNQTDARETTSHKESFEQIRKVSHEFL